MPVLAPKDYFLGPVFAATRQMGARRVIIGDRSYEIGGVNPFRRTHEMPALDVRHARAIFTLLSFRQPYEDVPCRLIRFSLNEFCRRYARSNGGRYARDIYNILGELGESYIRVTDMKTQVAHTYRLIERVDYEEHPIRRKDARLASDSQTEMWFNGCTLSPEFFGLLDRIVELQELDLEVFTSIRSSLAQAIYLYIPSRAVHHDEGQPFEITLTHLLEQVSFRVPRWKQRRKQIFSQHENQGRSILQQLDGLPTLTGTFRVKLAETIDGTDWKLQTWVEKRENRLPTDEGDSKVIAAYLKSGRPRELLHQALSNIEALNDYEIGLLVEAKVEFYKNRRFFEIARALLRSARFDSLLAEAKGDELEGRKAVKNQTARLIHRIMEAIGTPLVTQKAVHATQR